MGWNHTFDEGMHSWEGWRDGQTADWYWNGRLQIYGQDA